MESATPERWERQEAIEQKELPFRAHLRRFFWLSVPVSVSEAVDHGLFHPCSRTICFVPESIQNLSQGAHDQQPPTRIQSFLLYQYKPSIIQNLFQLSAIVVSTPKRVNCVGTDQNPSSTRTVRRLAPRRWHARGERALLIPLELLLFQFGSGWIDIDYV